MRTIYFDMDGTIANLYGVDNWLDKLRSYDPSPYAEAEVMLNMSLLARYLNKLQKMGYHISIISWLSKGSSFQYDRAVTKAKLEWLKVHLPSVNFDKIYITSYGITKNTYITSEHDILFDDNDKIRESWEGEARRPDEILKVLKELIDRG